MQRTTIGTSCIAALCVLLALGCAATVEDAEFEEFEDEPQSVAQTEAELAIAPADTPLSVVDPRVGVPEPATDLAVRKRPKGGSPSPKRKPVPDDCIARYLDCNAGCAYIPREYQAQYDDCVADCNGELQTCREIIIY